MVFVLNITNDDDLVVFECDSSYDPWIEILKCILQISYLIPGGKSYLNFILLFTIWFKHRDTYLTSPFFVIYSTDCFVSFLMIFCDIISRFIMYVPPLCPILSPYFFGPQIFFKGVMIVVNHSKTCKFIIQSLLVLNRMTCVMFPTSHIKMWMKRMKWLMVLIFVTPAATDWNLVISRVYMQPLFGGFASEYTRKVPWAKQSRFQLFFISVALFFTITCYSYTLHSLITLPHRIITAERTLTIATAYVSIGYVVLAGMQFFFAFFPYLLSNAFFAIALLSYDFLNVGSPVIMIVVTESLRHHVFRSKPAEQENQSHVFTVIKSRRLVSYLRIKTKFSGFSVS
ncbi:hypothetical protein CRE_24539 [Caenorhabditis remanei]|uniref:Serpentine receptor class gamma n=1 Tax=Caenorhabditis remanei TaxID=31234 RepID=E3MVA2_CAERE|nr:hypothetical protein CRE_24539 [Caenorhabditis remanei]